MRINKTERAGSFFKFHNSAFLIHTFPKSRRGDAVVAAGGVGLHGFAEIENAVGEIDVRQCGATIERTVSNDGDL
jgi:hypothetical protein